MRSLFFFLLLVAVSSCKKGKSVDQPITSFKYTAVTINEISNNFNNVVLNPVIKISFSSPISSTSLISNILFNEASGPSINFTATIENNNTIVISPNQNLLGFKAYTISLSNLKSTSGGNLEAPVEVLFNTGVDNTDKFPSISDDELLTLVQQQTFKYFWDFGHPTSGLARERNSSGNIVTSGGSGFGIMAIPVAINRGFISRADGLARLQKIVAFLKTADRFHGAYSHWLDGNTGKVIPFSQKDNGGDLVETSYLIAGLLTARQYFDGVNAAETTLRADINTIYNGVEWSWYRKNDSNTLYWHWSPNYNWDMNLPIKGWNECLITYILAASSPTFPIPKSVYDNGWAQNGNMKNGNTYYGVQLPLGPPSGGPLFFSHYSFLGINPFGLTDAYANYETQTKAHTLINYNYCKANPLNNYGYSENCWGLTASDIPNGYTASSPTNDVGVIAPTAALSSIPYTPTESMQALKFFYYKLGDKIWKEHGFVDAFSLKDQWFASSTLAIDQGPIIIMIENYRSKLVWNLLMSAPEIKTGMRGLGFTSPNL